MKSWLNSIVAVTAMCVGVSAHSESLIIGGDAYVSANVDTFTIDNSSGGEARNRAPAPVDGIASNLYLVSNQAPVAGSVAHVCVRVNGVDSNLCVTYTSADWPNPKSDLVHVVGVTRGDAVTLHYTETGGINSTANMRASFEVQSDVLFADGFETLVAGAAIDAVQISGEPYLPANAESFSIGSTSGTADRNQAAAPRDGTLEHLNVLPNVQPSPASLIQACLAVNGADTGLCTNYADINWPTAHSNDVTTVAVNQGDLISVHFRELNGVNSLANVRAAFDFAGAAGAGAVIITDDPYMLANADSFSIGGSTGEESRNSASVPHGGQIDQLFIIPNQQPAAGSSIHVCLRVNGVDSSLCADYTSAQWPNSVGNTATSVPVNAGDRISVHFQEVNGVASGANVRASFTFK